MIFVTSDQKKLIGYVCGNDNADYWIFNDDYVFKNSEDQAKYMNAVLKEAEHYAQTLLRDWKMGRCNEDVLIFFSKNDNVVRIMQISVLHLLIINFELDKYFWIYVFFYILHFLWMIHFL